MKNFKIIALIMLAGTMLFSSCAKDEDEIATPSIAFSNGNTELVFDGTNSVDVTIDVAAEGKVSDFVLVKKIKDATGTSENPITTDYDFKGETSGSFRFQRTAAEITADITLSTDDPKKVEYIFTLTDKEGSVKTATYTVKMAAAQAGLIDTHTPITMGSWTATEGSYYVSATGMVYKQTEVAGHESEIDFVFYVGNTNGATLAAPSNAEFQTGGSLATDYVCKDWSTKNATKFGTHVALTWTDITDDALIVANTEGLTATDAKNLAVGNIIPFVTEAGKKGVIKVNAIDPTVASGTITIEVKVQE